jgi:hypothetical protein
MAPPPNLEMAIEQSNGTIKNILEHLIWRAHDGGYSPVYVTASLGNRMLCGSGIAIMIHRARCP